MIKEITRDMIKGVYKGIYLDFKDADEYGVEYNELAPFWYIEVKTELYTYDILLTKPDGTLKTEEEQLKTLNEQEEEYISYMSTNSYDCDICGKEWGH